MGTQISSIEISKWVHKRNQIGKHVYFLIAIEMFYLCTRVCSGSEGTLTSVSIVGALMRKLCSPSAGLREPPEIALVALQHFPTLLFHVITRSIVNVVIATKNDAPVANPK